MNIAITGEGIVSAIGLNKQEVLQSLQEGRTGIGAVSYTHLDVYKRQCWLCAFFGKILKPV